MAEGKFPTIEGKETHKSGTKRRKERMKEIRKKSKRKKKRTEKKEMSGLEKTYGRKAKEVEEG